MAGVLKVDTLSTNDGSYSIDVASIKQAYANFYYSISDNTGSLTISSTAAYGQQMQFNKLGPYLNITPYIESSRWTHTYTGVYKIEISYRQDTGGDIWTVFAVTKNGESEAVGVSSRTGSINGPFDQRQVIYTVDNTSATYQLQHWTLTSSKTVRSDFSGKPGWANYDQLVGNTTGDTGRMVDYLITRLGDLNV